jgi:hypothetical protein
MTDATRTSRPDPDPTEATTAQLKEAIRAAARFYVYVGERPITGLICYVGKGTYRRIEAHDRMLRRGKHHNSHLQNIYDKHGSIVWSKIRENLTEQQAFETEMSLIAHFGRVNSGNGCLANRTDGGDGEAGVIPVIAIAKARAFNTGRPLSSEHREKLKMRQSQVMSSPEARAKVSASLKGITRSPETRAKMSAWRKGKSFGPPSPEHRAKLSAANKGVKKSPEHIANVVAARRTFFAARRLSTENG